jgi:hypothetical protein
MGSVEFEENNSFENETLRKRFSDESDKKNLSPLYTRLFLLVIVVCFSVSIFILFRAFRPQQVDTASFQKQYQSQGLP